MKQFPLLLVGFGIRRWEGYGREEYWDKSGLLFYVDRSEQGYGPTHIQYGSRFGFLLTWPFCFHIWLQFRPQQFKRNGDRIVGSEIVLYARTPGFRWDAGDDRYVRTKGFIGLHWD